MAQKEINNDADVMTAYGSLKSSVPFTSIAEETAAAEMGIAEDAMKSMRADE